MAVKDKLVTLEDLKTAYDKLKEMLDMYEDITSSLTWNNATWLPGGTTKQTQGVQIATVKVAKIAVTKGDRFRFTSWLTSSIPLNNGGSTSYGSASPTPYVFTDASDNIVGYSIIPISSRSGPDPMFVETLATAPNSAKYMYIFDIGGTDKVAKTIGDIIVEKGI